LSINSSLHRKTHIEMRFVLLILSVLAPAVCGLQAGGYLSQLSHRATNGVHGGSPLAEPPYLSFGMTPPYTMTTIVTASGPSQNLVDLFSAQVSIELRASQLYLSASIWFRARDMPGMAAWMLD
jgi:hypothetical protein